MVLKLYFDMLSQPSRALLILLRSSKIPFEECPVALRKGEHLTETYKNTISRFQKVPVIKDDNFVLTESIAILRYLSREKQLPESWYPKDSKSQAAVDEFLEWHHIGLRVPCARYFQVKWLLPLITGQEPNPKKLDGYEKIMKKSLDDLEELWLKSSSNIIGNELSAADLWAACEVEQIRIAGFNPEQERPILKTWLNKVRQSLNPHYGDAHKVLNKLAEKSGQGLSSKL